MNSTVTLQSVVDFAATIGDINPVLSVGGYATSPALTIANDVMAELINQRFNWKFNRMVVPPFYTNSWQQDYATVNLNTIGWLEHAVAVDINNTALPKPIYSMETVKDLERTSLQTGRPFKVCWLPNDQLVQGAWSANSTYTNPLGATSQPANPPTNILDAHGNILVLTQYGTSGSVAPDAGANAVVGAVVNDGTVKWTVADPNGQGFRIAPLPGQTGVVYQLYIVAQARSQALTSLGQTLDPLPDDMAKYFREGFIAKCYGHSANPVVRAQFPIKQAMWLQALADARGTNDQEKTDAGFVPDRPIMSAGSSFNLGAENPYGWF